MVNIVRGDERGKKEEENQYFLTRETLGGVGWVVKSEILSSEIIDLARGGRLVVNFAISTELKQIFLVLLKVKIAKKVL